jgi:superfamily II DNA or RNA helicase
MSVSLYPDQSALVDNISREMRDHKSVLVQAATGFGKTRIAAHIIDRAVRKGSAVGFLAPRRELIRQTSHSLKSFGLEHGFVCSGHRPSPFSKIQVMSTGTLARRLDVAPKLKILAVDECHFGGSELDRIIRHYQGLGTWIIGLSATPMKVSGQGMGEWYDSMVSGPSIRWLMDNKRLSEYRAFAPDVPDLSSVPKSNGDYVQKHVNDYMMSDERGKVLVGNAAKHYKDHAYGKLNISFCTSVKAAQMSAQMFNDQGIPSAAVHGGMDDAELAKIIKAFARRELLNITNAQLLCFGFDLAQASGIDVTIESMSDLAPTKSLPWQLQKWGRVLRMKQDPALIFDHSGNTQEHGLPDSDREWNLEAKEKRKRSDAEKTEPTRQCTQCYMVHRPTPECPGCGFVYPIMSRTIQEVDGELQEVTSTQKKMKKPQEVGFIARSEGLKGLIEYGKDQGYKNPTVWATKQMKVRKL